MMQDDDHNLDSLFAAARAETAVPTASLTARVLADAEGLWAQPKAVAAPRKPGILQALSGLFGGSGALAGMATATVAGLYIGYAQPVETGFVTLVLGTETADIELMPGLDALLEEVP